MMLPVDTIDEHIAAGISFEARELYDTQRGPNSAYIRTFLTDYLDDTANTLRALRASQGDSGKAVDRIAQTLGWRETTKVYPGKRHSVGNLLVDKQGLVVVNARKRSLTSTVKARAVETLEDARLMLKAVYDTHRAVASAAVVVPLESVSLARISIDEIRLINEIARTHYPGLVGHVYLTASASVMLEHSRRYVRAWGLGAPQAERLTLVLAGELAVTPIDDFMRDPPKTPHMHKHEPAKTTLDDFVKGQRQQQGGNSAGAETEADEFHSVYSDARETNTDPSGITADLQRRTSSRGSRRLVSLPSTPSLSKFLDQPGGRHSALVMSALPKDDRPDELDTVSGEEAEKSDEPRRFGSMTSIQLASLQRAVQGVQRMLSSIGDNIGTADSQAVLDSAKSKLSQQTDVLMSTVAALSFGVSLMENKQPPTSKAFYIASVAGSRKDPNGSTWQSFLSRVLAVPLALLFGRPGSAVKIMRLVASRVARVVARRVRGLPGLQTILMLAYKHLRVYAMVCWTGAFLLYQANAAMIWSNLTAQWSRGIRM
ncbi:hypothetical protein EC988_002404 [Linderina pennispora]|nr:hypothetical protein EC988_002404 [Linderina pennispora]